MFGILFLIIIPLCVIFYIKAIIVIARSCSSRTRKIIYFVTLGLPLAYPFVHLVSPSYHEFNALCDDSDRVNVFKTIPVESFPAVIFDTGYKALREKHYSSFVYGSEIFTPTDKWESNQCIQSCDKGYRKLCFDNECLNRNYLSSESGLLQYRSTYDSSDHVSIFNSMLRTSIERLVSEEHGVLAERYRYTYYPYGVGWASILGAASGSAPSYDCKTRARFDYFIITPKK
jgi:hypothetical protein